MIQKTFLKIITLLTALLFPIAMAFAAEKPVIAVLTLDAKNISTVHADIIRDILEVHLHKQGCFKILEREQINLVIKEKQVQMAMCSEEQCALNYGKMLSADMIVIGTISRLGNYTISVKLVDVAKGEIIAADYEVAETEREFNTAAHKLATRISITARRDKKPEKKSKHPIHIGLAYQFGFWNLPLPALRLPDNYGDPIKVGRMTDIVTFDSVEVSIMYGLNNYLAVKANIQGIFCSKESIKFSENVYLDSNNTFITDNRLISKGFNGLGTNVLLQAHYTYRRLQPFISLGCGYQYLRNNFYTNSANVRRSQISPGAGDCTYGDFTFKQSVNLFTITGELGMNIMFNDSIGITLSFVCTYAVKQSYVRGLSYKTIYYDNDNGLLPADYEEMTTSSLNQTDALHVPPMYIIHVGWIYRLS